MNIRSYETSDLDELKRIHSLHFANEFDLPEFLEYLCVFVVEDEKGIITFGGIRDIAECVTVTNKDRTAKDRAKALYQILHASSYTACNLGYDQIYAWSQNRDWARHLRRVGFRPPVGQSLILDL
jgi:citrate lyase synthetase